MAEVEAKREPATPYLARHSEKVSQTADWNHALRQHGFARLTSENNIPVLCTRRGFGRTDLEKARLHQEIPHSAGLVDVDLDEVSRLPPAQFAAAPCVLAHQRLLDDQVRFGQYAKL